MEGMGRHSVLAVHSVDPLLSMVAPVGLAASVTTALIVDAGPRTSETPRTLADLVDEGPTRAELSPGRTGVALISTGGVLVSDLPEALAELAGHWPAIVVRSEGPLNGMANVPVVPVFPPATRLLPHDGVAVWQPVGATGRAPGPGPVLPRLPAAQLKRLLVGRISRRSRWIDAWRPVWRLPWA